MVIRTRWKADLLRVLLLFVVATVMVEGSAAMGRWTGEPAYSPLLLFTGLTLYGAGLAHLLRRVVFPYIDLKKYAEKASQNSISSGLVFVGVSIVLAAFMLLLGNVVHADELPQNARQYLPVLVHEQQAWWPAMPLPSSLAAQVEQETCVSLKSRRCWSPLAELRTSREQGVGLGQITRTSRFDALAEIRAAYPQALAGWDWGKPSLYDARFQLQALVLKDFQGFQSVIGAADDTARLAFTFAGYNGGIGGVISDRKVCQATPGCDAGKWFGNVERTSLKRRAAVGGYGKSFFDINREYVRNVLIVRRQKYIEAMKT